MKGKMKKVLIALSVLGAMALSVIGVGCGAEDALNQWACNHDYGTEATSTTEATCYETGKIVYTCNLCGKEKTEVLEKVAHAYEDRVVVKEATCTSTGTLEYRCINEGCTAKKTESLSKLSHTVEEVEGVDATCTEQGYMAYKYCSVCDTTIVPKVTTSAKGHKRVTDKGYAATCTTAGETDGSHCERCGIVFKEQEVIYALGHNPVIDPAVEPDCGGGNTQGEHCDRCGFVITAQEVIPGNGNHPSTEEVAEVAAMCTTAGVSAGTVCTTCNEVVSGCEEIPALGHDYDDTKTCTRCGEHEHVEIVVEAVAATCAKEGRESYTYCEDCGKILSGSDKVIDKLPHTEVLLEAVASTCTTTGSTEGKECSDCGAVLIKQEEVPMLSEHVYNDFMECTSCDYEYVTPGLKYKLSEDKTYYIVEGISVGSDIYDENGFWIGSSGSSFDIHTEVLVIPQKLNGLPVLEIKENAFNNIDDPLVYGAQGLSTIIIKGPTYSALDPSKRLRVGAGAFANIDSVKKIVISGVVQCEVADYAAGYEKRGQFANLSNLEEIVLGGSGTGFFTANASKPIADGVDVFSRKNAYTAVTIRFADWKYPSISKGLFNGIGTFEIIPIKGNELGYTNENWVTYEDHFVWSE